MLPTASFWGHVATTLIAVLGGLFIGASLAILLGYFIANRRWSIHWSHRWSWLRKRFPSSRLHRCCHLVRLRHHAQDRDRAC